MHPARWDDSVDLNGKRVALVGYGCMYDRASVSSIRGADVDL